MALQINSNVMALNVRRTMTRNKVAVDSRIETISSGLRVQRASSDASGLVISEGMRTKMAGLAQNLRNTEQASDLLQVAEGSLAQVSRILLRLRELAVQAAAGSFTDEQREILASEFNQGRGAIDRIAQNTTYNDTILLAGFSSVVADQSTASTDSATTGVDQVQVSGAEVGTYTFVDPGGDSTLTLGNGLTTQTVDLGTRLDGGKVAPGTRAVANFDRLGRQVGLRGSTDTGEGDYVTGELDGKTIVVVAATGGIFQVGPDARDQDRLEFRLTDLRGSSNVLGLARESLNSQASARASLSTLDRAIARIANERGRIGALQNRLSFSLTSNENALENLNASDSTIRDADVARESTALSRAQILNQTSSAMLTQAFQASRLALQLL